MRKKTEKPKCVNCDGEGCYLCDCKEIEDIEADKTC